MHLLRIFAFGLTVAIPSIASPLDTPELAAADEQTNKHDKDVSRHDHQLHERVLSGAQSCTSVEQGSSLHYTISIGISDGLWRCNAAYNAVSTECDTNGKGDQCIEDWSCKATSDGQGYYHIKFLALSQNQGQALDSQLLTVFPEIMSFNCPNFKQRGDGKGGASVNPPALGSQGAESAAIAGGGKGAATTIPVAMTSSPIGVAASPLSAAMRQSSQQAVALQMTTCYLVTLFGAQDYLMSSRCQTQAVTLATTMAQATGAAPPWEE
ncbi:hypothetical protein Tdes44962_MAKER07555 [Teratosphaeria destructans]|uniref:Uncharacterized protein n=1 Tax=Teratosphaeria destructans TaxID=418781 RepID=A0A9W7SZ59_9PEZI|nr:hypothetical protein Tdes44962_MAKER07555 [Teratosphaeria destructans]